MSYWPSIGSKGRSYFKTVPFIEPKNDRPRLGVGNELGDWLAMFGHDVLTASLSHPRH
jgi:hypothetical protein